MAGPDRGLERGHGWRQWLDRLTAEPQRHQFVDVVDLLTRATDKLELHHGTSLGYSRGELESVTLRESSEGVTASVTAAFFGLGGETTPLPLTMAEEADRDDDHAAIVRGTLDLFHQRLLALLHTAIAGIDHPHTFRDDGKDRWTESILAFLGVADRKTSLTPAQLLRLAPILATRVRSPEMLEAGLRIVLDGMLDKATVVVNPFTGEWMEIDKPEWSRLGGTNAALGNSTVLGTSVIHRAGAASINIGPLSGTTYREFTPGGAAHTRIQEMLASFVAAPVQLEMVLSIEDMTYPPARLGERKLGDDLWLARSKTGGLATTIRVPVGGPS
jgi:type VI secretion system protein ImpH